MTRYLDRYEVAHLDAPTAFVVDCVGDLDDSALAAAFALLCGQHPALAGRIRHDGYGHVLDTRDGHRATFRPQWTGGGGYPRDVAEDWDVSRSLSTLAVTRMSGRVRVALYLDHCVGDGKYMYALCESLWRFYGDIVTGAKLSVPPRRVPPAPLAVLAERTGTSVEDPTRTAPGHAPMSTLRYRRVQLTEAETTALVTHARAHRVSVYGLLAAAVVAAQRARTVWAVIDLRDRVDPPVGPTDTTNFASATIVRVAGGDLIAVAHEVRTRVLAAIADGDPHRNVHDNTVGRDMARARPSLAAAIVSNLGAVPDLATPPGLTITDFRIWPYGWRHPAPMYMASTYGGRLGVDMVFRADVHDDDTADTLASTVTATLRMAST